MRRPAALAFVALALAAVGACGSDGRSLATPPPGASAPPVPRSSSTSIPVPFTLASGAFENGAPIPQRYTCDGGNISPPFTWGAVPQGTVELVLTVTDPDANGFVHWVLAGIDPTVQAVPENTVPDGAIEVTNDGGTIGWTGPCPPEGAPHTYVFNLYALTSPSGVTADMTGDDAILTIGNSSGVIATITGTYQRA